MCLLQVTLVIFMDVIKPKFLEPRYEYYLEAYLQISVAGSLQKTASATL